MKLQRALLAAIVCTWGLLALCQSRSLQVERRGDQLYVSAPQLHFIQGRALEKLHNGSAVAYVIALTVLTEHTEKPLFTLRERFVISFDLWEEKYSVVPGRRGGRSASRLTATSAESWCLENMPIPVGGVPDNQLFVIRLECSIDPSEAATKDSDNSALTLSSIIDVFSRKKSESPLRWVASAGSIRLSDVKNSK